MTTEGNRNRGAVTTTEATAANGDDPSGGSDPDDQLGARWR